MEWRRIYERNKCEEKIAKNEIIYAKLGLEREKIDALNEYDRTITRSDCRYYTHLCFNSNFEVDFSELPDYLYESDMITSIEENHIDRYWWVEEIGNRELAKYLKKLNESDIELLTMYAFEGLTQKEIGKKMKVTQQCICKKLSRIKRDMEKLSFKLTA